MLLLSLNLAANCCLVISGSHKPNVTQVSLNIMKVKQVKISYLSVTVGRMKNIQKWIPKTKMTWKTSFPKTVFLKYRALSITMVPADRKVDSETGKRQTGEQIDRQVHVPNWIRTITKKASGTWSSEREEVMSAAAECFWEIKLKLNQIESFQENNVWAKHDVNQILLRRPRSRRRWRWSQQCQRGTWGHKHQWLRCILVGRELWRTEGLDGRETYT